MRIALCALLVFLVACSDDEPEVPACVELAQACEPLYEPTFDNAYDRTFSRTCSGVGSSCHGPAGGQGGLTFDGADAAHSYLLGSGLVVPEDPSCSPLQVRIEGGGAGVMPPGALMSQAERCAIQQWIEQGAPR